MSKAKAIEILTHVKNHLSGMLDDDGHVFFEVDDAIKELEDPQNDNSWTVEYGRPHRDACQDAILYRERQRVDIELSDSNGDRTGTTR